MKRHLVLILTLALLLPLFVVPGQAKLIKKNKTGKDTSPSNLFVEAKTIQTQESDAPPAQQQEVQPISRKAVRFAESLPLRDLPAPGPDRNTSVFSPAEVETAEANPQNAEEIKPQLSKVRAALDPLIQTNLMGEKAMSADAPDAPNAMPGPSLTFEGMSSIDNVNASGGSTVMPPDTVGDVGPNHYVQNTNFLFNVFNKTTGAQLLPGGRRYSQLFGPLGGICSTRNDGDPIVLYDQWADRWMISQFCTANDPFNHQLIAVSKTPDPTGAYYLYDFQMPNIHFQDYPHFGIWHDGYYMTANVFQSASTTNIFHGAGAYAFDRKRMLAGDPAASMIFIDESTVDPTAGGQLPTDADGFIPPPTSVPQLICEFRDTEFGDPIDGLRCFEFKPNFDNPAATTFVQLADFPTAPFDGRNPGGRVDVEQPPPATSAHNLDSVGGRLMNRLVYRNFGTAAAPDNRWVTNWTVNVSGVPPVNASTYQAGVRWTEFTRSGAGAMSVRDQGTYVNGAISPTTGENDWMGSAAQDNQGNIAVGFSASSTTLKPAIKWAGRTGAAPTGTLNEGEALMFAGTGSQLATNSRWGDYSSINTDPVDDCAFWFTTEYRTLANESAAGSTPFFWNTRIGTFKFPSCTSAPRGVINGTVTFNGNPVPNAMVYTTNGFFAITDGSGNYTINNVGPDSYTLVGFKRGIGVAPTTVPTVTVTNGAVTTQNINLSPAADVVLVAPVVTEGVFSNGNGLVDPGETGNISVTLNNPSPLVTATGVTATLSVKNPTAGVYVAQPPTRSFGDLAPGASANNAGAPFRFTLAAQTPVATTIEFVLKVDFGGGQSPTFLYFQYFVGTTPAVLSTIPNTTLDTTPPAVPPAATSATTGTQTGRLVRSGAGSGCGTAKASPGLNDTTPNRQYDAYTYTNATNNILCVTVTVNQTSTLLYTAAYGNGGFNPANPAANFLGDPGSSASTMAYSFDVPPNSNFTIVVHEVTVGGGIGQAYNASISFVAYNIPPVRRRSDFDVDLKSDIAVFRPSNGFWYFRNSSTGVYESTFWGAATDKPVPGDYDGDGETDFAVYRPSENNWYIRYSFDGTGTVKSFGSAGTPPIIPADIPVPGDYDGDGKTDIAVFRPSEGKWYYIGSYANTLSFQAWGNSDDKLVPADYDGDGKTDFATFRPSNGNWYIKRSTGGQTITGWGLSTDVLVPADYDGDRRADIAVFRASEGNWYIRNSSGGVTVRNWGNSSDTPVPADYDGDNKADIAVWRPADGNWYIINSTGAPAVTILNLGNPGDRPVPLDYIPTP